MEYRHEGRKVKSDIQGHEWLRNAGVPPALSLPIVGWCRGEEQGRRDACATGGSLLRASSPCMGAIQRGHASDIRCCCPSVHLRDCLFGPCGCGTAQGLPCLRFLRVQVRRGAGHLQGLARTELWCELHTAARDRMGQHPGTGGARYLWCGAFLHTPP